MFRNETVVLTLARLFFFGIFLFCHPQVWMVCGRQPTLPLEHQMPVEATVCQASRNIPMHFARICFCKCILGACLAGTRAVLKWRLYVVMRNCNCLFSRGSIHVIVLYTLWGLYFILHRGSYFCSVLLSRCCGTRHWGVWSRVDAFLLPINKYLFSYQVVLILRFIWY